MGDIVMASPLVAALRARYPDAHIAWLVQPEFADLLVDLPGLDEVVRMPRGHWRKLAKSRRYLTLAGELRGFRRALRSREFDLVLDIQGLIKSALPAWWSGAKRRISLGAREGSRLLMTEVLDAQGGDNRRMSSEYRHLAAHLGLAPGDFRLSLGISDEARSSARDLLAQALARYAVNATGGSGIPAANEPAHLHQAPIAAGSRCHGGTELSQDLPPYAVICPFTTRPQKHWFNDAWFELVGKLGDELSLPVVMLGGPSDREAAQALAKESDVIDLVGQTSLQQAAAIIADAQALIGVDTGLTHMGTAAGIPTIALFGSTCPYLETDSTNTRVIYHSLDCSPCRRRPTCEGAFTCLRDITADEVLATLRPLLDVR